MKNIGVEITIILSILRIWSPITANITDEYNEHQSTLHGNGSTIPSRNHTLVKRCWNSVIPGRPTLAKVVVAGSFFIVMALIAGWSLFCHTYCKHKIEFAEIEDDLLAGRRCFKPQLEDLETGFLSMRISKPASFMKRVLQKKIGRSKKDEMEDEDSEGDEEGEDNDQEEDDDNDEENEKPNTPPPEGLLKISGPKKRERMRDEEESEDESPVHAGDQRKPNKGENVIQGKAKGAELQNKEQLNLAEKGERSLKSDPMKKDKKPGEKLDLKKKEKTEQPDQKKKKKEASEKPKDKKEAGKTVKDPKKRTEGKTKKEEKRAKNVGKTKVKKQEVAKKVKKEKKIKAPKPGKAKIKKAKKVKPPKKK